MFLYSVIELIMNKGEIILSDEGIEIRNKGWNHWEYVDSFKTILDKDNQNSDKEYLIIYLKDSTEIKCLVSNLDKSQIEIVGLLKKYKTDIIYLGHEIE